MTDDLKFAGVSPVVINYNGDTGDIYAPVRTSNCDVTIVSPEILDDLYTAKLNEIGVRITEKEKNYVDQVTITDYGRCLSNKITPQPTSDEQYTIIRNKQFYIDVNGNFRFRGMIENNQGETYSLNLKFNYTTRYWEKNNDWKLSDYTNETNWYFYDETGTSYKVIYDYPTHYILTWSSGNWTNQTAYLKYEDGVSSDMAYDAKYIVHLTNSTELIFGKYRYLWDPTNRVWNQTTSFTDSEGADYFAMYGNWCMKVKDRNGNLVDACIVNGLDSEDWIVRLDRSSNTFTRMIKIDSSYDLDNIFTDDYGNLYCIKASGEMYFWNWTANQWIKWFTFEGTDQFVADSFYLDYIAPGTVETGGTRFKRVVIRYTKPNTVRNYYGAVMIYGFTNPTVEVEQVWDGTYVDKIIWEGYKMPNTYSQDTTLNLDEILMTCIDPVSIMKYITIDKILEKPAMVTYGELIGAAIAKVKLTSNRLVVENTVTYGSQFWFGDNGLLDLKCQVSNFWDESEKPDTIYKMIEELLRPFCLTFQYVDDSYQIFNANKTTGTRVFEEYTVGDDGTLTYVREFNEEEQVLDFAHGDWISNNTSTATIEIDNTYDKVTGTGSTSVPTWSKMAMDLIDYNQRDLYDAGWMNVQLNKTKGLIKNGGTIAPDTNDKWFYIWNGVYTDANYALEAHSGDINWHLNINQAWEYLNDSSTQSSDYGSILNFYGGSNNPTGTGKSQNVEKSVEIHKKITAYAADNGTPPEFLETSDLAWTTNGYYLTKPDQNSNSKFGVNVDMGTSNKVVYSQTYENINLGFLTNPELELNLTRSFSRTGLDFPIKVMNNNTATNCTYALVGGRLTGADSNYFPEVWNEDKVMVNTIYFRKYTAGSSGTRCRAIWDKRRINMYVELGDGSVLQFNGKEWISDLHPEVANSFYLVRLMNFEKLFHNEQAYNLIETSDGEHYSLTGEPFVYYQDNTDHSIYDHDPGTSATRMEAPVYQYSNKTGYLSVTLPYVEEANVKVIVDVYNSTMLGMTGSSEAGGSGPVPFYYPKRNGSGYDEAEGESGGGLWVSFIPLNATHIKAEHLDLTITVSSPESNLGQMFSQSDIEYTIKSDKDFVEEFSGPSFQVNTYNQLVASSFSYVLFGNNYADPYSFVIAGVAARPECYTVQAYYNWLCTIRKIYSKTILPKKALDRPFSNARTMIWSPEVGSQYLLVIKDSWDIKSNRHTLTSVESSGLDVTTVGVVDAVEIPRKARAERWNLPTATQK